MRSPQTYRAERKKIVRSMRPYQEWREVVPGASLTGSNISGFKTQLILKQVPGPKSKSQIVRGSGLRGSEHTPSRYFPHQGLRERARRRGQL